MDYHQAYQYLVNTLTFVSPGIIVEAIAHWEGQIKELDFTENELRVAREALENWRGDYSDDEVNFRAQQTKEEIITLAHRILGERVRLN